MHMFCHFIVRKGSVMAEETPSSVMYADLRTFGGIAHRDAARAIISNRATFGGRPIAARIDERTFLSREIVHARPGSLAPELFAEFPVCAKSLTARLIAARGGNQAGCSEVIAHYRGTAAERMLEALAQNGIDAAPYANSVRKIISLHLQLESDRALLLVMLFIATGCLADASSAVRIVESFAETHLSASLGTLVSDHVSLPVNTTGNAGTRLGLVRIVDGAFRPPIHELSNDPDGTVIGCLPAGEHTITDVDPDVSREHARICCNDGGWFIEDLNSTNGTQIISGTDRATRDVIPCASVPDGNPSPQTAEPAGAVEIDNSDIICLGATTRFLVMRLTS